MKALLNSARAFWVFLAIWILAAALYLSPAHAATFNLFSPATGILKGMTSTYVTTSASVSDIVALFSGTCNSSTVLKGDGTCGVGTSSSVPTTVQGDLLYASGTNTLAALAKNTSATRYLSNTGTSNNPAWAQVALDTGVSGTLPAANGGLGMSTVTDDTVAVANGTTWQSKTLPDCTDTGGNHINYTASTNAWSCGTSGGATGANPSASVGLTAVNGSASTFMRSDAAPALSQSIAPTWTGVHTFSGTGSRISLTGGGTSSSRIDWVNTGGTLWAGVDNSGGGAVISGGSAYGAVLATTGATALTLGTNGAARVPISSAGNVTINAPSSGTPLTANRGTAGIVAAFTGPSQSAYIYTDTSSAYFASDASANTSIQLNESSDFVSVYTAGVERTRVASAGNVTINAPSSGTALTTTATSTDYAAIFNGTARGVSIRAGSTTSDYPLIVDNGAASVDHFIINGVGAIAVNNGSYGTSGQVLTSSGSSAAPTWTTVASCTTGSFTGTATGMTGATTGTVNYRVCGNVAWLWTQGGAITGTSNTTSLTMTGLAAAVQPSHGHIVNCTPTDNSAIVMGMCSVSASTITVYSGNSSTGFTASGSKGFVNGWTVSYPLD